MDVEIGSNSPTIAFSRFSQANPLAMQLPATAVVPPASITNSGYHNTNSNSNPNAFYSNSDFIQYQQRNLDVGGTRKMRKRKAESQDNERLSKRLSLLNLGKMVFYARSTPSIRHAPLTSFLVTEQNGQKLYVPVESPKLRPTECTSLTQIPENDSMQLDDSKHKVYIYNLDDELSESESDSEGRLVFLPDIEKHLMQNRIPPSLLANKDGEIAGMQMVLYSEPTSLTVPKEQDSVRKAIIEARQRVREKQKEERENPPSTPNPTTSPSTLNTQNTPFTPMTLNGINGFSNYDATSTYANDPDAMEVD
ncbi:hypothetical protein F5Y04DRAFT_27426 [Hypomontagnella monticulosa]|nr:hypothetical protein F5Y04DRAFT_27426 [Hypomontagnella monticulosa]